MKKNIVWVSGLGLLLTGTLFGQISFSPAEGLNLGNAIKVTSAQTLLENRPSGINVGNVIQIQSDGGLKIGTPPVYYTSRPAPGWMFGLGTQGLEVSVGDVLFHIAGERNFKISFHNVVETNGNMMVKYATTALTGASLSFGTSTAYAYGVYSNNITSLKPIRTTSDRRCKENIQTLSDAKEKLLQLRPVSYDLKIPANYEGDTMGLKNKVGFIA